MNPIKSGASSFDCPLGGLGTCCNSNFLGGAGYSDSKGNGSGMGGDSSSSGLYGGFGIGGASGSDQVKNEDSSDASGTCWRSSIGGVVRRDDC